MKKTICPTCKGNKKVNYLIDMHDNETTLGLCHNCKGVGHINELSSNDEGYGYFFCYW